LGIKADYAIANLPYKLGKHWLNIWIVGADIFILLIAGDHHERQRK
jgi:hypothetical protein